MLQHSNFNSVKETKDHLKNGASLKRFSFLIFAIFFCFTLSWGQANIQKIISDAESGDLKSMFDLGYAYYKGNGVAKSLDKAIYWFSKVEEHPDDSLSDIAQALIAVCYEDKGNHTQAFLWMEKAANQDNIEAQHQLARYYFGKIGTPFNEEKAVYWLKRAASQGSEDAVTALEKIAQINQEYAIKSFLANLSSSSGSSSSASSSSNKDIDPDKVSIPSYKITTSWKERAFLSTSHGEEYLQATFNDGIKVEISRYKSDKVPFFRGSESVGLSLKWDWKYKTDDDAIKAAYVYEKYDKRRTIGKK